MQRGFSASPRVPSRDGTSNQMDLQPVHFARPFPHTSNRRKACSPGTVPPIPRPSICSTASTPASSTRRSNGARSSSPTPKSATPPSRSTMPASRSPATTTSLTGPRSPPTSKPSRRKAPSSNSNPLSKPWSMATSPCWQDALRRDPALVRARSSRVCCFDPPVHRATLLHYVAANGVEAYRQKTPPERRRDRPRAAPGRRRARRPCRHVRRRVHHHEHAGVEQPPG